MRTLVRELPYEKPIAGGRYRYERNGQPTGALESWRLSSATDGYQFLRVDLNAQGAESGDSYLYHLLRRADGHPERLTFHFFRTGLEIKGIMLFSDTHVTLSRRVNGRRYVDEVVTAEPYVFWFPATAGLGLLAALPDGKRMQAVTLNRDENFALWHTEVKVTTCEPETVEVMGQAQLAHTIAVHWADEERTLWLNHDHWPVRMKRGDLVAMETRYLRYQ